MILLDTNVVSELMKVQPSSAVVSWIDQQESANLFLSSVTIAEISYGISVLPDGKRRQGLDNAFNKAILKAFEHRILFFDQAAAFLYGKIMGQRKVAGKPMSLADGQIAAIAQANRLAVATRNIEDFEGCGLDLVNPYLK